jgi:hypothetical protein
VCVCVCERERERERGRRRAVCGAAHLALASLHECERKRRRERKRGKESMQRKLRGKVGTCCLSSKRPGEWAFYRQTERLFTSRYLSNYNVSKEGNKGMKVKVRG